MSDFQVLLATGENYSFVVTVVNASMSSVCIQIGMLAVTQWHKSLRSVEVQNGDVQTVLHAISVAR